MNTHARNGLHRISHDECPHIIVRPGNQIATGDAEPAVRLADRLEAFASMERELQRVSGSIPKVAQFEHAGRTVRYSQTLGMSFVRRQNPYFIRFHRMLDQYETRLRTTKRTYQIGKCRAHHGQSRTTDGQPIRHLNVIVHSILPFVGSGCYLATSSLPAKGPTPEENAAMPAATPTKICRPSDVKKTNRSLPAGLTTGSTGGRHHPSKGPAMNTKPLLAISALAALAWLIAHTGCTHPIANLLALAAYTIAGSLLLLPNALNWFTTSLKNLGDDDNE